MCGLKMPMGVTFKTAMLKVNLQPDARWRNPMSVGYLSPEAYLLGENDRVDGIKYEYVNGQVYAMAGAS